VLQSLIRHIREMRRLEASVAVPQR
jgi:hypothetical protein